MASTITPPPCGDPVAEFIHDAYDYPWVGTRVVENLGAVMTDRAVGDRAIIHEMVEGPDAALVHYDGHYDAYQWRIDSRADGASMLPGPDGWMGVAACFDQAGVCYVVVQAPDWDDDRARLYSYTPDGGEIPGYTETLLHESDTIALLLGNGTTSLDQGAYLRSSQCDGRWLVLGGALNTGGDSYPVGLISIDLQNLPATSDAPVAAWVQALDANGDDELNGWSTKLLRSGNDLVLVGSELLPPGEGMSRGRAGAIVLTGAWSTPMTIARSFTIAESDPNAFSDAAAADGVLVTTHWSGFILDEDAEEESPDLHVVCGWAIATGARMWSHTIPWGSFALADQVGVNGQHVAVTYATGIPT